MIIAGLDPGSIVFGVGLIEKKGSDLVYLKSEDIIFPNLEFKVGKYLQILTTKPYQECVTSQD